MRKFILGLAGAVCIAAIISFVTGMKFPASIGQLSDFLIQRITLPGKSSQSAGAALRPAEEKKNVNARVGEIIVYDIMMGKLKLGTAVFRHLPDEDLNGKPVQVTQFDTRMVRFKDTEKIYSDPQTRLPVKVTREIQNLLKRENITEDYDQKAFKVAIGKRAGSRSSRFEIKKDRPIHNAILLPHYARDLPDLKEGMTFEANLPTRGYVMRVTGVEDVQAPAGMFKAYHLVSRPRQIEIWISADRHRIPLKIQGMGLFNYTMVLRRYEAPDSKSVDSDDGGIS